MSISETVPMEDLVLQVTDHFDLQMRKRLEETPEMRVDMAMAMWRAQCSYASMDLMTQIHVLIDQVELKLLTGEYFNESVLG